MQEVKLCSPLIFKDFYNFNKEEVLAKCELTSLVQLGPVQIGDAKTSVAKVLGLNEINLDPTQPHLWPELKDFVIWTLAKSREILNKWQFEYEDVVIVKSWINKHQQGGQTLSHYHHNADLVVVSYVQAPKDCGDLLINDPLEYHWAGLKTHMNNMMMFGKSIVPEDNMVLFLAPFLRHSTGVNLTDQDRWSLNLDIRAIHKINPTKEKENYVSTNGN